MTDLVPLFLCGRKSCSAYLRPHDHIDQTYSDQLMVTWLQLLFIKGNVLAAVSPPLSSSFHLPSHIPALCHHYCSFFLYVPLLLSHFSLPHCCFAWHFWQKLGQVLVIPQNLSNLSFSSDYDASMTEATWNLRLKITAFAFPGEAS